MSVQCDMVEHRTAIYCEMPWEVGCPELAINAFIVPMGSGSVVLYRCAQHQIVLSQYSSIACVSIEQAVIIEVTGK